MPPQTREAFMLRRVHGLPQREIAVRMQLSESTVEKHISRGIRFLIDWFGHRGKTHSQTSKGTVPAKIGRASCRERGCTSGLISVVAGSLKKIQKLFKVSAF